ncbi:MAG: uroporphyrin-3 C-methyltransferase [Parasphingorhabdus sp.]|jgi:uroporphyrin-3 C-methyltransferase
MNDQNKSNLDSATETPSAAMVKQSASSWPLVVISLFSITAMIVAGFAWYQVAVIARLEIGQQGSTVDRVSEDYASLRADSDRTLKSLQELDRQIIDLKRELQTSLAAEHDQSSAALKQFKTEVDGLSQSVEQVYRDLGRTVNTWMLEETEQLLLLANQRLSLDGDVRLAITALKLSDGKLKEIGDPGLLPVRQQLATEISELAAVPVLDIAGAALRLQALMQSVAKLPLNEDMSGPQWEIGEAETENSTDDVLSSLQSAGEEFVADLKKLVRIRKVEDTRLPKLKPVQRFLVYENLRLMLNTTRNALLRKDELIYQSTIADAQAWIEQYIASDDALGDRYRSELDELGKLQIAPQLPSIENSLILLRSKIGELQRR